MNGLVKFKKHQLGINVISKKIVFIATIAMTCFNPTVYAAVDIQTWYTYKGTKVLYVHAPEISMVDVEVKFDAGSARDGNAWGIANFTAGMFGTGTKTLTEDEVSSAFNDIGAQFGAGSSRDSATLSLRTLTRKEILTSALVTFSDVLAQPVFPVDIFERERSRLLLGLKQKTTRAGSVASEHMWEKLYGLHPYAHPTSGSIDTVMQFHPKMLQDFYETHYVASNAQISIVGAVTKEQAMSIAEQITHNLPMGRKPGVIPKPYPQEMAMEKRIAFDAKQTTYRLAQIGVERGHKDYVPLFVGNHLLGGSGFSSLLMAEVREKRGLAYSVYSHFIPMKVAGPFMIGLSTKNKSADESEQVVRTVLTTFMTDFDEKKLQAIKDNLINGFPLRMDSNGKILSYISMIGFYNLPLDYLDAFPAKITAVTKKEILDAWKNHIDLNRMLTVTVGKDQGKQETSKGLVVDLSASIQQ